VQDQGIAGMVKSAVWFENTLGMEVLTLGRTAEDTLAGEDCVMELAGAQLYYRLSLRGTWLWVRAAGLDESDMPSLFNLPDGPGGWTDLRRFVQSLERSGIRALHPRPIYIGEGGPDSFVIA
jgi:hypothetical protein